MTLQAADLEELAWDKQDGLLPAIVQHATSGAVLMLAYMNREALRATLERGRAVFYSRSRQQLWEKGETSGHTLRVIGDPPRLRRRHAAGDGAARRPRLPSRARRPASATKPLSAAEQLAFLAELEAHH